MKLWPIFPLILLAPHAAMAGPAEVPASRKGDEALAAGLWEVAEMHFRQGLADASLTPEAKSNVAIRLAESLIRSGNPVEALEILGQSFVEKDPETPFWKALALVGQNRISEAAGILSARLADPTAPYRTETSLTLASLQLALDQPEAALATLTALVPEADAAALAGVQLEPSGNPARSQADRRSPRGDAADGEGHRQGPPARGISGRPTSSQRGTSGRSSGRISRTHQSAARSVASAPSLLRDRFGRCHLQLREIRMTPRNRCWHFLQNHPDSPNLDGDFPAHPAMAAGKTHRHRSGA